MDPRPANALDRDALLEQLSRLDSSDPAIGSEPPSTVRELKAELETLIGELRQPVEPEPFADETGLRRAQELVLAIGLEPEAESKSKARDEQPELGRIGPYELLEKLGEGGMGAVYKALHSSLEKIVALKVLPRERLNPQAIARFKREMKAVGKLDHGNIVRATDAGEADGDHFLVMEYVDGVDLAELLRRVGPLPASEACELVRQAAVGLQHAHQRGMVHRDIKPNNIMLAWGDEHAPAVKILDMGLALLNEQKAPAHGDLTTTGQMMGTLEYMSPEQGLDTHNVDIRADIYSLGATLYKLLCGKAPFAGEHYNTPGKLMVALATQTPPSLGTQRNDLPAGLVAVVDRMLARDPAARPATPAEVAQALAPFAIGADLPRLANTVRQHGMSSLKSTDESIMPTADYLSSPSTGTSPTLKPEAQGVGWDEYSSPTTQPVVAAKMVGLEYSSHPTKLSRLIPKQRVALALGGVLLLLLAAVVYRIQTDQGTLVVTIEDSAVQVILEQDGLVIRDTHNNDNKWNIKATATKPLPSGEYQLQVDQRLLVTDDNGVELATDTFTLKRKGEVRVRVTLEQAARVAGKKGGVVEPVVELDRSAWDDLDPAQIPEAERVPRQPEGLVAVLGQHRRRVWNRILSSSVSPDGNQFLLTTDDGLHLFGRDPQQPARLADPRCFAATFLPDGRIAAFVVDEGAKQNQLQFFAKPREGRPLEKQTATNVGVAGGMATASSDGQWLAAFEQFENGSVGFGLWRLRDAAPQRAAKFVLPSPHGGILPGSFSPDAHWFCFTDNSIAQSAVHLIDLRGDTPREATVLKAEADEKSDAPAKGFEHAAFLSDGRLATADRNGRTWFWKINDGDPERVGSIRDTGWFAAAAQSLRLVVGIGGTTFRVWDLAADSPQLLGKSSASFQSDNIGTLAIAPNGETVLTGHHNGAIRLWNVSQAGVTEIDPLAPNPRCDEGRTKIVDRYLCASPESQRVGLWKPTRNGLQAVPAVPPSRFLLDASPTQRQLIVREASDQGIALLRCDVDGVTSTRLFSGRAHSAALNDEGRRLVVGRHNGTDYVLELWGLDSDDLPARKLSEIKLSEIKSSDKVVQLAFAEAGRALVGRFYGGRIQIWNVKDDQLIPRATLPPRVFYQFAVAPDGQTLATVEGQRALEVWNLKSDLTKPTTSIAVPHAIAVAFSPDGRRLAASFWENGASAGVQIINLATGDVEKRLTFPGRVYELTFTDDSRHLITGNANATIYVVRLEPAPTKPSVTSAATSTTSPQALATNPDRRAAEYVLSIGGYVETQKDNHNSGVRATKDLPTGVFSVYRIDLPPTVNDANLVRLNGLANLSNLGLNCPQISGVGLEQLQTLPTLNYLNLNTSKVSGKELRHLKNFPQLETLSIQATSVGDDGMEHLKSLTSLRHLDVGFTDVGDAELAHLKTRTDLESLWLPGTQVSDIGLKHLYGLSGLRVLELVRTKATADGIKSLAAALPGCKIEWDGGVIEPRPTDHNRQAAEWMVSVGGGGSFRLSGEAQDHDFASVKDLPSKTFTVTSVNFPVKSSATDAGMKQLEGLADVESLGFPGTQIGDAGIGFLKNNKKLGAANFSYSKVTGEGLVHLKGSHVFYLELTGLKISGAGCQTLGEMPTLRSLIIANTDINDADMPHLAKLKNLYWLTLHGTQLTEPGIKYLAEMKSLGSLTLPSTTTDQCLVHIAGLTNLVTLDMGESLVTDEGLLHFKGLANLERLGLSHTKITGKGLVHLKGLNKLKVLVLWNAPFLEDGGLEHLKTMTGLKQLILGTTKVTPAGIADLQKALPECKIE